MNDALQRIKAPAIALLIVGILNGGLAVITLLSGLFRLSGAMGREGVPASEAERAGYIAGTAASYGVALVALIAAPLIIYGASKMMRGKNYGLSKAAAILAIVPLTSCCFLVGIPVGIWALVILQRPETRMLFSGQFDHGFPPPPPSRYT